MKGSQIMRKEFNNTAVSTTLTPTCRIDFKPNDLRCYKV